MLTKLLKKDFQSTARYFIPLIIGLIIISILNKILFEVAFMTWTDNQFLFLISILLLTLYFIYILGFYLLTYVIIVGDFYKTMVSEEAYLTHTLPVKISTLLYSKVIVSVIWQTLMVLLIIASCFLLVIGHLHELDFSSVSMLIEYFSGMSFGLYMTLVIIFSFLGFFSSTLLFFASIALGHLFGKHRVLGAILSYIVIYSVLQVISLILFIIFGNSISMTSMSIGVFPDTFGGLITSFVLPSAVYALFLPTVFYIITHYIFKKKLNLE